MGRANLLVIASIIEVLAAASCTGDGDGSGPNRSAFVAYWADGDAWCDHVAECGISVKKECERNWPKADEIEDALALAQLSDEQLTKCDLAQHALDACFLERSCADLSSSVGPACPAQKQRADLDCASLILAFGMMPIEVADEGDDDSSFEGTAPTADNLRLAQMLCQHSLDCSGEPNAATLDACVDAVGSTLAQIPNPSRVIGCVLGLSCETLQASADAEDMCLMIDSERTQCLDSQTLELCDTDGACVRTDCESFCTSRDLSFMGCGLSEEDGYDQCLCEL